MSVSLALTDEDAAYPNTINSAAEHRRLLIATMEGVVQGRINVPQANAVAALSCEVHKSIRQEWDMRVYAAEHLGLTKGNQICLVDQSHDQTSDAAD